MSPTLARRLIFLAVPLAFGLVALSMGMDADWDLRNYHYYNAWALLTDRYGLDVAAAQIPSFYNPVLDVPHFLLAQLLPARGVAFVLGMVHGLNFILLTLLGERLLTIAAPGRRLAVAAGVAGAGVCGAVALSEVGTVFYDNVLSLGVEGSLLLVAARWEQLRRADWRWALLAGLPVGLAFGVKQPAVVFPLGLCAAVLLTLPASPWRRFWATFCFGLGVLAGTALGGGYWMVHLWHLYGNPTFPYFNQIFRSPWGLPEAYRDSQYTDGPLWQRLVYPFLFSTHSRIASEIVFRDFRILAAFVLLPVAGLAALLRRGVPAETFVARGPAAYVMTAAALAYAVWLVMFANYRYLVPLEMLAPLLVVLAIGMLPGPARPRLVVALALVGVLVVTTQPGTWIRVPFTAHAVEVEHPPIADPDHTIVLLAGHEPLSFLLPSFPPQMRFLRIDSTFTNPDETTVLFNPLMRSIIQAHRGPLLALYIPTERHDVVKRLGNLGLVLTGDACGKVTSPIGAMPYDLCAVAPAAPAAPVQGNTAP